VPVSPDVLVIGGGVIGLTIARRLCADGLSVTLLERDLCGRGASWAGAGVLAPPNPHRKDAVAALHLRSLPMFPPFCAELLDETGIDSEYERSTEIEVALDERGLASLRSDAEAAGGRCTPDGRRAFEMLSIDEARRMQPRITPDAAGGMWCRETAQIRNPRLLAALRASCEKRGVVLREGASVGEMVLDGDRVTGVKVGGEAISAGWTILCAGAWSAQIDLRLAALMPVKPVRGQMVLMKLDRRPFAHVISRGKTYWVPRRDGHVLLGATEEHDAGFAIRNTPKGIAGLIEKGLRLVPSMAEAPIATTWAGLRPGTADDLPYLGPVPGFDGLIAATGHFRSGLSLAPATAEFVSSCVRGERFDLDLACAAPGRR